MAAASCSTTARTPSRRSGPTLSSSASASSEARAVVVDDSEGIGARLDAAMQESIDAYVDPWLERDAPATSHQFTSLVPVEG